jgi:polyhydroxybutyrate depolymerase
MLRAVLFNQSRNSRLSRLHLLLPAVITCVLLAGCASASAPSQALLPGAGKYQPSVNTFPINAPVATAGCGHVSPILPGTSVTVTINAHPAEAIGMSTRTYRLHLPKHYNDTIPQAVILAFHGFGGTAEGMEGGSGFSALADAQGFIAVYPQGLPQPHTAKPFWAEIGPIDYGVDDVLFVSDILSDLQKKLCVDAHRIYATGFSNGGGLTTLLACRLAGRIAAFAPISGNNYAIPGGCHPGRPVSILDIHGSADTLLPYNGIPPSVNPDWPLPPVMQYLREWAERDGCTTGPTIFLHAPKVTGIRWTGCQDNVSVMHYRIEGGGHSWPPLITRRTPAEVLWQFFSQYRLP